MERLRAEIARLTRELEEVRAGAAVLREALEESVKYQSHYADLLNMYDGGERMQFADAQAWLDRLAALKDGGLGTRGGRARIRVERREDDDPTF